MSKLARRHTDETKAKIKESMLLVRLSGAYDSNGCIRRETRMCKCGCNETFTCKITSKQLFIDHHYGRLYIGVNNSQYGRVYTIAERKRKSEELLGYKHSIETRRKYSEVACKRVSDNPELTYSRGIHGWIDLPKIGRFYYLSSWEKEALTNLDRCNLVSFVLKDKVRVPYVFEGTNRYYIVDFQIHTKDGFTYLVEVKADWELQMPQIKAKIEAGKSYAKSVGMIYQIWGKKVCFDYNSVTTMLTKATSLTTATCQEELGRRYSLNSAVTQRREQK